MNTSEHILVILLSCTLAVLLVLVIFVAVLVIRLLKAVNRITDKAEQVVQSAEHIGTVLSTVALKAAGPAAIIKIVKNIVKLAGKHNEHKKK